MSFTLDGIKKYKEELGYDPNPSNTLLVEKLGLKSFWLGPLTSKYYVISFETDGLLFMGCDLLYKWTGSNFFIPIDEISNLTLKKSYFINGRLMFNASKFSFNSIKDSKNNDFLCYDYILPKPFVKENRSNVEKVIANYPSMAERRKLAEAKKQKQSTSNLDELAKLKKLLNDSAITQEEYDAKKKQLLDL